MPTPADAVEAYRAGQTARVGSANPFAGRRVRRQLRDARGETFAWVKPHTFRKTVATLVEREASLTDAAAQLGHSGTEVTTWHYVQRAQVAPDLSGILDLLAPVAGEVPASSAEE